MNETPSREAILLGEALALPADRRLDYVNQACGQDAELCRAVQALLDAHEGAGAFLQTATSGGRLLAAAANPILAAAENSVPVQKPGDRIGRYKLLEQIGEGGCGVVFMAEQEKPVRRRVALKIIKLGMDTKSVIARFEAERQALAMMDHPNIAKVLDAGATETGRPYFVMELVRGVKITEYCDQLKLSTEQRLDLFIAVCQAVQHAHQKGIVHRDLKPSNILVTEHDGAAVPKIIDFGIAKATTDQRLTDKTLFTAFEQFIGTPAYTSPEQAGLGGLDIDTRSDIYSLGVLLYELLTGQPPFSASAFQRSAIDEILRIIRETEPSRPSARLTTLNERELTTVAQHRQVESSKLPALVRGDLDWIVMKCLEKDRTRRYETANGLAADIQRHLNNEPVIACPPSNVYRFRKMVRRNKLAVSAAGAVTTALLLGLGISTWMFFKERQARQRAVLAEHQAEIARTNEAALRLQAETLRTNEVLLRVAAEIARTNEAILRREAEIARTDEATMRVAAQASERKARTEADMREQVARLLKEMLAGVGPSVARGRDTALLREILDKTAKRIGKSLTNQPAVEAELRATMGRVYYHLGLYAEAELMDRRVLALRTALVGPDHNDVATALANLVPVLAQSGKFEEAESATRRALTILTNSPSSDERDRAICLDTLAQVLDVRGKLSEAEELYHQAIALNRKLGEDRPNVFNGLGLLLRKRAKFGEAEAMFREAITLQTNSAGSDDPALAKMLNNLASALIDQRRLEDAEPVAKEALAVTRKLLGDDHPFIATCLNTIAQIQINRGQFAEAEAEFRETLARLERAQVKELPPIATSMNNIAYALWKQHKLSEAEEMYRRSLSVATNALGGESMEVARPLHNLARVLRDQGRLSESALMLRQSLDLWRKLFGDRHPEVGIALNELVDVFLRGRLYDKGEQFFDELLTPVHGSRPPSAAFHTARINFLARRAQWTEALTAIAGLSARGPDSKRFEHHTMLLLAAKGDHEGYRASCRRAFAQLSATNNPGAIVSLAQGCVILPASEVDPEAVGKWVDSAIETAQQKWPEDAREWRPGYQFAKGLAEYRQGRFASALDLMAGPLRSSGSRTIPHLPLEAQLVRAMALWQLNQRDDARAALAQGLELAKTDLPRADSGDIGEHWLDWVTAHALMNEAKSLVDAKPSAGAETP